MKPIDRLKYFFNINDSLLNRQAEGVTHEESVKQFPFRSNCFNWNVGHVINSRRYLLEQLEGEPLSTELDLNSLFGRGSEAVTEADAAVPFAELLTLWAESQEKVLAALNEEKLATVIDEESGRTMQERVDFLLWHETYHVGQMEILRQLAGKDDSVID